jgi:phosphohistidine phosphatase
VRAVQTAEIIAEVYGIPVSETTTSLSPDAELNEFEEWCADVGEVKRLGVVGHEPHLTTLVTWLLTGHAESRLQLKKGGACLLEFDSRVKRDSGTLSWLMMPRQLGSLQVAG